MPRRHVRLNYGNENQFEFEIDSDRLVAAPSAPRPNRPVQGRASGRPASAGRFSVGRAGRHSGRPRHAGAGPLHARFGQPGRRDLGDPGAARTRSGSLRRDPARDAHGLRTARSASRAARGDPAACPLDAARSDAARSMRLLGGDRHGRTDLPCPRGRRRRLPDLRRARSPSIRLMGYRGTNSVFYPGLSSADAMLRTHGQGHLELGPDEARPLRDLVDEVGWLLGNPFTVQVIPAASQGVSRVLAGVCDPVFAQGKKLLAEAVACGGRRAAGRRDCRHRP